MTKRLLLLKLDVEGPISDEAIQSFVRDDEEIKKRIEWSARGTPHRARKDGNVTSVQWEEDAASVVDLTRHAHLLMSEGAADRLVISAHIPLPLALLVGVRLFGATYPIDVINFTGNVSYPPVRTRITTTASLLTPDLLRRDDEVGPSTDTRGTLVLSIGTAPYKAVDETLTKALGRANVTVAARVNVTPLSPLTITDENLPTLRRQVAALTERLNLERPDARDLLLVLRGPVQLAIAIGSVINANTWRSIRFAHYESESYQFPVAVPSASRTGGTRPSAILHLSDLHLSKDSRVPILVKQLADGLKIHDSEGGYQAIVISGDLTNRGTPEEFERAREFVETLCSKLHVSKSNVCIVPGNHDLCWDVPARSWKWLRGMETAPKDSVEFKADGGLRGALAVDDAQYPRRFENFANFYKALFDEEWSLKHERQFSIIPVAESNLCLVGLNSAWEIDEARKGNASLDPEAVYTAITKVKRESGITPIFVCHHPISKKSTDNGLLDAMAQAGVPLLLHGHVHEHSVRTSTSRDRSGMLHAVSVGTLSSNAAVRPESTPALFAVLRVKASQRECTVHVFKREREFGVITPHADFDEGKPGTRANHFELKW